MLSFLEAFVKLPYVSKHFVYLICVFFPNNFKQILLQDYKICSVKE